MPNESWLPSLRRRSVPSWPKPWPPSPGNLGYLAKEASGILMTGYLLPAQRAALYDLLTRTPGMTVVRNVRDAAGRPGVGIKWTLDGTAAMNIFDPRTFAFLGRTVWNPQTGQPDGEALLQIAVADRPGQLP